MRFSSRTRSGAPPSAAPAPFGVRPVRVEVAHVRPRQHVAKAAPVRRYGPRHDALPEHRGEPGPFVPVPLRLAAPPPAGRPGSPAPVPWGFGRAALDTAARPCPQGARLLRLWILLHHGGPRNTATVSPRYPAGRRPLDGPGTLASSRRRGAGMQRTAHSLRSGRSRWPPHSGHRPAASRARRRPRTSAGPPGRADAPPAIVTWRQPQAAGSGRTGHDPAGHVRRRTVYTPRRRGIARVLSGFRAPGGAGRRTPVSLIAANMTVAKRFNPHFPGQFLIFRPGLHL